MLRGGLIEEVPLQTLFKKSDEKSNTNFANYVQKQIKKMRSYLAIIQRKNIIVIK